MAVERNLPMRWVLLILVACAAIGCRSQSTPLTNPFLAPDRVPPPATGAIAPGTAQPYYPGDPVPGAVPPSVVPGGSYPPSGAASPTYSPQTAPVTPPGGWSQPAASPYGVTPTTGFAPIGTGAAENSAVQIAPDSQNLRFASVTNASPNNIMQVAANQQLTTNSPYIYTPPTPIVSQGFPSTVQPAQFVTPVPGTASDGFRPQGSAQLTSTASQPVANQGTGLTQEDPNRFGFDGSYSWLRGQLQYYPQTEQWGVRYIPSHGTPDPYGGVAVIANPDVLVGVQPGEYLLIQGTLEALDNGDGTFVPAFTVEGIQRQR